MIYYTIYAVEMKLLISLCINAAYLLICISHMQNKGFSHYADHIMRVTEGWTLNALKLKYIDFMTLVIPTLRV